MKFSDSGNWIQRKMVFLGVLAMNSVIKCTCTKWRPRVHINSSAKEERKRRKSEQRDRKRDALQFTKYHGSELRNLRFPVWLSSILPSVRASDGVASRNRNPYSRRPVKRFNAKPAARRSFCSARYRAPQCTLSGSLIIAQLLSFSLVLCHFPC